MLLHRKEKLVLPFLQQVSFGGAILLNVADSLNYFKTYIMGE